MSLGWKLSWICFGKQEIERKKDMYYLGIDVGSVSTDFVVMGEDGILLDQLYLKTGGNPIQAVTHGLKLLGERWQNEEVLGVGATGSGRSLASSIAGADVVKNEITAHGIAAAVIDPEIRTVLEIGGQDSKIILLQDGVITDFAMNTVCAAGTGSFLDRQAERMGIPVSSLGDYALRGTNPAVIAGRCAVFAESDIIHKQQLGCSMENLIAGMCQALVRNYLSNVGKGKKIRPRVCFQGGVAANSGIRRAFEEALCCEVTVPEYHKVMGAYGAAVLAREQLLRTGEKSRFRGFEAGRQSVRSETLSCGDCENHCQVVQIFSNEKQIGCFSDRCGKYQRMSQA